MIKSLYSLLLVIILISCNTNKKKEQLSPTLDTVSKPTDKTNSLPSSKKENTKIEYAKGLKITNYGNYRLLEINNALPKQIKIHRYILVTREQAMVSTFNKDTHDGIITIPIEHIAINSLEHNNILKALNVYHTVIDRNVSENSIELLQKKPNLIISSGKNGLNDKLEHLKKANIPLIYTGEWNEKSFEAKTEWLKLFATLYLKEKEGDLLFKKQLDSQKL